MTIGIIIVLIGQFFTTWLCECLQCYLYDNYDFLSTLHCSTLFICFSNHYALLRNQHFVLMWKQHNINNNNILKIMGEKGGSGFAGGTRNEMVNSPIERRGLKWMGESGEWVYWMP